MKQLFVTLLLVTLSTACLRAQWTEANRKQSSPLMGNGALLVHDGKMYLWNEEHHFQISSDNGATWSDPLDSIGGANPHVRTITAAGGRIYAGLNFGTGNGVPIYSTDDGVTWQPDTLGAPGHALGWGGMPAVSDIYAWGHWLYIKWDQPAPYQIKTFDGAYTPNAFMGEGANNPSSVVAKGDTLFAAGSKIYYTTDGGATFTVPANNGYSGYGGKLFVDGSRLYMFAYKAWQKPVYLYYSDDNAENWTEVDVSSLTSRKIVNGDPYFPLAFFIKGNRIEFAADMEKFGAPPNVWKSTDLGATWDRDTTGLIASHVNSVSKFAYTNDGTLWCVPSYNNIFKQKIDEGTGGGNTQVTVAPRLVTPHQGEEITLDRRFEWGSAANAVGYHLQIATDAAFASLVVDRADLTDTSMMITALAGGTYFWRVRGIGAGEQAGPWSEAGSFSISTAAGVASHDVREVAALPNPSHDRFTVQLPEGRYVSLELRDLLGRTVRSERDLGGRASLTVDVAGLAPGRYWLLVKSAQGDVRASAIVVE